MLDLEGGRCRSGSVATAGRRVLVLAVAAVLVWSAPQHAGAVTLREAIAAAYKNNPQLDADRARQRATDEEVARAYSGYRPTVNGTASISRNYNDSNPAANNNGVTTPKSYGLNATQSLFDGFRTDYSVRVAEAQVRAGRANLLVVEQNVLLSVVQSYMDVVRDQTIVSIRENNVEVLSRELRATRDRFAVGEVTRTDVAQAEARRAGAVSSLELARSNLKTSRASFERVVGFPPTGLVTPSAHNKLLPRSLPDAITLGTRDAPTVVAALYNEQAARFQVDQIRAGLLPQVNLQAQYNRSFNPSRVTDDSESASLTTQLTVPLYEAGNIQAQVRQAKQTHVQRIQQIEQARTEARAAVISAWSQLEAARAAVQSDLALVQANQIALAGVREEERVGQRTLLDVLNAEQELLNAQVNLATDQRTLVVASYTLLSAIGRLTALDLGVTDTIYDADVHYQEVRRKWWGVDITHADGRRERLDATPAGAKGAPAK